MVPSAGVKRDGSHNDAIYEKEMWGELEGYRKVEWDGK